MGISPHTELKHTNTTNRIYKYKASALQMKTRLQQTGTDTNTNIYRKQDQTGRTPMGRSPHREQQHKHTQAYTRSLLLVSITIQLLFECLNTLHTLLVSITIQLLFECLNTLHTLVVSIS